jgi:phage host-nuclease inhibitor protein Gam
METKAGFTEAVDLAVHEAFAVRDAESANWVIRKIGDSRLYALRVKAWAAAELRRAERQEQFFMMRYGKQLEDWARQQIEQQHDCRRSVSLPAGNVGFRAEPTRLSVVDEAKLLAWAKRHLPSALRTIETIAKTTLTDHLKATGEVADGAEFVGGTERFYVSAKYPKNNEGAQDGFAEQEGE